MMIICNAQYICKDTCFFLLALRRIRGVVNRDITGEDIGISLKMIQIIKLQMDKSQKEIIPRL